MTGDNFMRYPKFLPEKGTIGFVAPAFGCATEPYYTAFLKGLLITRLQGHEIRSDIALIGNMARIIKNKEDHHRMMTQYNEILKKIAAIPDSFGSAGTDIGIAMAERGLWTDVCSSFFIMTYPKKSIF